MLPDSKDVNLNHLFLFRAVAEGRGFSRAAENVHVSQLAISMQVGELESQLGLTLFHRLPRGVQLAAAGRFLLGYATAQRISGRGERSDTGRGRTGVSGGCPGVSI